jgi:hypothetical protein
MSTSGGVQTGLKTVTDRYYHSGIDMFPRTNKSYIVESSIEARSDRDYLPTNCSLFNGRVTDSFIEFTINSSSLEFIDLGSMSLQLKVTITNADRSDVAADANITLVDGFFHRLFASHAVFLNNTQCEGNTFFGLLNLVKSYTSMDRNKLDSFGRNMFYKSLSTPLVESFNAAYFTNMPAGSDESSIIRNCRGTLEMTGPLMTDLHDTDCYLCDKVDYRIRLELTPPAVLIKTASAEAYKYRIDMAKLWVKKLDLFLMQC